MVYQEKNKNKWTKDGRKWYFKCYYTDMYGKRKQKVSKLYATKTEAQDEERLFIGKTNFKDETDHNITFQEVYEEWLDLKKSQLKSTSYYGRKKRADYHILSYFKPFKLHSIKINVIRNFKEHIMSLPFGIEYKNRLLIDLKDILTFACNNYNFDVKVLSKIYTVKIESVDKERISNWNFWTNTEFKKFISVVDSELYYVMFNFMYYTGLRLGEVIALNWRDIDFENKKLRINKTLSNKIEDQIYIITTPKTRNSLRVIDLDDNLISLLKDHKENQKQLYDFNEDMFVFGGARYIAPTSFKRYLYKYISIAGVKKITPHGFRHSHVSLLIDIGCDSRDVAERVGDTISMVENTYYHMFPQKKGNVVKVLNRLNNS